jgi:hypothetical protein
VTIPPSDLSDWWDISGNMSGPRAVEQSRGRIYVTYVYVRSLSDIKLDQKDTSNKLESKNKSQVTLLQQTWQQNR